MLRSAQTGYSVDSFTKTLVKSVSPGPNVTVSPSHTARLNIAVYNSSETCMSQSDTRDHVNWVLVLRSWLSLGKGARFVHKQTRHVGLLTRRQNK